MLEQVGREPLDGVGGSLLHERRHTVEQKGHHGLVEVGTDGQGLKVQLLLGSLEISLGLLDLE